MKFRVMSDLHLEFGRIDIPVMEDEENTILLLVGDICVASKRSTHGTFFQDMVKRFKHVVMIFGNHEYYDGSLVRAYHKFWDLIELTDKDLGCTPTADNMTVLDRDSLLLPDCGVKIIGATMWTSFRNGNPNVMMSARFGMNDYNVIRYGNKTGYERAARPEDIFQLHQLDKEYVFEELDRQELFMKDGQPQRYQHIIMTHHAPSQQSIHGDYCNEGDMNDLYANNFDYRMESTTCLPLYVHGHTHHSFDYMIGNTRVLCNPRGYLGYSENPNFDPCLVVEVGD